MNRILRTFLLVSVCIGRLEAENQPSQAAVSPTNTTATPPPVKTATKTNAKQGPGVVSDAMMQFGLDMARCTEQMTSGCGSNNVLSPLSAVNALTMVLSGSSGNSYSQLLRALNYPEAVKEDTITNELRFINDKLKALNQVKIKVANGLFSLEPLSDDVRAKAKKNFDGEALMAKDPETVTPVGFANFVNQWVSNKTESKIQNVIAQLAPETKFVLANAVYFKGSWADSFGTEFTREMNFTVSSDEIYPVLSMFNIMDVKYVEDSDLKCKMIALPYKNRDVAMYVLLPTETEGVSSLNQLEPKLNASVINQLIGKMVKKSVSVTLPKFRIENSVNLKTLLMMKGATDLFMADTANLSRMFKSNESLSIDEVMHKTFIEVTETGTEAAAATLVFLTRESPKKVFQATQPFLFFIRDDRSGATLFSGRLVRPTPAETKQI